jgi:nickel-dependent lactate racemase
MVQIGAWAQMWMVTDLGDEIVKKTMMKPYESIQSALDDAVKTIKARNEQPKIVVMPFGSLTIPLTEGGE